MLHWDFDFNTITTDKGVAPGTKRQIYATPHPHPYTNSRPEFRSIFNIQGKRKNNRKWNFISVLTS
jgi:hypothetical protein